MAILKLIGIIAFVILGVFSLKRLIFAILNLNALRQYKKHPDPISQRHGIIYNKRTGKLEADQSPILPYE